MAASKEPEYPPFVLGKPRFNQETYYGRLRHFMEVVDPATLLTSEVSANTTLACVLCPMPCALVGLHQSLIGALESTVGSLPPFMMT
jgi:hypothetical protein